MGERRTGVKHILIHDPWAGIVIVLSARQVPWKGFFANVRQCVMVSSIAHHSAQHLQQEPRSVSVTAVVGDPVSERSCQGAEETEEQSGLSRCRVS